MYWRNRAKNHFLLYQALGEEKYFIEALKALANAYEIAPTDPKAPYTEALFYSTKLDKKLSQTQKDFVVEQFLKSIDLAVSLKSNYRDAYFLKGLTLKKLKDIEGAKTAFGYILKNIDSNDEEVTRELDAL